MPVPIAGEGKPPVTTSGLEGVLALGEARPSNRDSPVYAVRYSQLAAPERRMQTIIRPTAIDRPSAGSDFFCAIELLIFPSGSGALPLAFS